MKTVALIVAGGKSVRFGGEVPKQFRNICGRPMLSWAIESFEKAKSVDQILVVVPEDYMIYTSEKVIDPYDFSKVTKVVAGGESRPESVYNGLQAISDTTDFVAIHDGARPLVTPEDIDKVIVAARKDKAAILAMKATDTVKRVRDSFVISTLERDSLYMAQTPQVFQYSLILDVHREYAEQDGEDPATDDASMVEKKGFKVRTIEPSSPNFKITSADDLVLAEAILKGRGYE
jgi:2-C-methyl-D-erythritol 4-phosphate cytidylyltransferase